VNKADKEGQTPLWFACNAGADEIVKILLKDGRGRGIHVNQGDKNGRTPLWIACDQRRKEIVKILLKDGRGIEVNQGDCTEKHHFGLLVAGKEEKLMSPRKWLKKWVGVLKLLLVSQRSKDTLKLLI